MNPSVLLRRLLSLVLLLLVPLGARATPPEAELVRAELVADVAEVAPGTPFTVGLRLRMHEGWHTYWRNPGDSGLPTTIDWELPPGFEVGPIRWPAPARFVIGPVTNFGYEDEAMLLAEVRPPQRLEAGASLRIGATASWLVCQEECIPGGATVERMLRVGPAPVQAEERLFADARARLPVEAPWPAALDVEDDKLALRVAALGASPIVSAFFFPHPDTVVNHSAPQSLARGPDGLVLELPPSPLATGAPEALEGVLVVEEDLGGSTARQAFAVRAVTAGAAVAAVPAAAAPLAAAEAPPLGLLQVLAFALLGGVILNAMPCVFPVLSLKVLGVAQQASEAPGRIRLHGLAYTAGILASFALLVAALLALRAGGAQIGWGFQLQSPPFVALLAFGLFALALSLSGVLYFGGSVAGIGSSLAARPGLSGSFFTGVLATVVATPCTAPFMGAAVGFALLQPAAIALAIFLALGLGLALPFLLLSFVPALHRLLPRPGAWMETMKQALAFPLYGTVAWLVWVLHLQVGPNGLAAVLAGLVLVGFAAWAWGASRAAGLRMRRVGGAASLAAVATAAALLLRLPAPVEAAPANAGAAQGGLQAEAWSPERQEALLAAGKPVFVNFTAAWCVTCLVNEQTAMSTASVQALFEEKGIAYLKGDWTNRDPAITTALERFGRSGVPLYLLYAGGAKEPVVLPQILTESTVRTYLETL